jgi:hypothetical protein
MSNLVITLYQWYDRLKRKYPDQTVVEKLSARIIDASDAHEIKALNGILAGELAAQGRYAEAEKIRHEVAAEYPDDPSPLEIIEQSLQRAKRTGNFQRQAFGVKARTGIALNRYDVVAHVLRELIFLKVERNHMDVGLERDFFDKIPSDAIDPELARQFEEYTRRITSTAGSTR